MKMKDQSRRNAIKKGLTLVGGALVAPTIVPSSVFGSTAPSNQIHVGQIGIGRIALTHDLPETIKHDFVKIVAVSDVDSKRMQFGKKYVEEYYKKNTSTSVEARMYDDYKQMLESDEIDAVVISTPDHWHAQPAMEAALRGKDVYLQKPAALTIEEGRAMSNTFHQTGQILQIGSQQRSVSPWPQFKRTCELVRNGRIGELHTVEVGLPGDPSGDIEPEMPIPSNLNYDMWLGSTPYKYYTEKRVHSQADVYSRPGWLRCRQFGAGMITGWGAHHIDTAHWGMGTEYTGPIEVEGTAEFPKSGLWNVHGPFRTTAKYANGVTMHVSGDFPNGVKFIGTEGWIFVSRGNVSVTDSDPSGGGDNPAFKASNPSILESRIGPDEIHLQVSEEQHLDWLQSIRSRKAPVAPAEVAHRSTSACLVNHIAMELGRKVFWDPQKERFLNDDEANAKLSRPQRFPFGTSYVG